MAGLLVSVRSAKEAEAAVAGGASVIDVKEPDLGPLGRADVTTWRAVRAAVPASIPVSVALGELGEITEIPPGSFEGIAYRKLGLARSGVGWQARWAEVRRMMGGSTPWVAVVYADWEAAGSPDPDSILDAALAVPDCSGILVDTWEKSRPGWLGDLIPWVGWIARARQGGCLVTLAGGLNLARIALLAPLRPDLFAVRGAACVGSDRRGEIDPGRVAGLVYAAASAGPPSDSDRASK